jgi:hypothetical protein
MTKPYTITTSTGLLHLQASSPTHAILTAQELSPGAIIIRVTRDDQWK